MSFAVRVCALLLLGASTTRADDMPPCFSDSVEAHVRQQFALFGPLSINHEYFGFIYRIGNEVDSAVVRGSRCVGRSCIVSLAKAAALIPARAVVLGEWHTHPRNGEAALSEQDVLGAYRNRKLGCYAAFYSEPDGSIFSWSPRRGTVSTAMASRVHIGGFGAAPAGSRAIASN